MILLDEEYYKQPIPFDRSSSKQILQSPTKQYRCLQSLDGNNQTLQPFNRFQLFYTKQHSYSLNEKNPNDTNTCWQTLFKTTFSFLFDEFNNSIKFMLNYFKHFAVKLLLQFVPGAITILEWILRLGTNNTNNATAAATTSSSLSSVNNLIHRERKISRQSSLNSGNCSQCNRKFSPIGSPCTRRGCRSNLLDKLKPSTVTEFSEPFENLFTVPNDLFSFTNLVKNLLLEVTYLARFYRWSLLMRERFKTMFRWRPTSLEDLDQAEQRIFSFLKCKYKSYYVDIGKGWDLDNVRIWTVEIPHVDCNQKLASIAKSSLLSKTNQQLFASQQHQQLQQKAQITIPSNGNKNGNLPLVMVHGFAAGVGLWSLNFDELSEYGNRTIYAFDLLGFAKSSRPKFTFPKFNRMTTLQKNKAEAEKMEEYLVDSIEKWRKAIGGELDNKFILLGHSFGAYLSLAYALRHPEHVAHLVLADPWGLPPENHSRHISSTHYTSSRQLPFWMKAIGRLFLEVFTPLSLLRALGPWGPGLIYRLRPDLRKKFQRLTNDARDAENKGTEGSDADISSNSESDDEIKAKVSKGKDEPVTEKDSKSDMIIDYIYHCNAQPKPSGEIAFQKLCTPTAWARLPMLERIIELEPQITITFIYGSRSWVDRQSGFQAKYILATASSSPAVGANSSDETETNDEEKERVKVLILQGAGHHVYADMPEEYNQLVLKVCADVDASNKIESTDESTTECTEEDDSSNQHQQPQQQQQPQKISQTELLTSGGNRSKPFTINNSSSLTNSSSNNSNGTAQGNSQINNYNNKFGGNSLPKQIIPEEDY